MVLQCADLSHCPLASKYGPPHHSQQHQQEINAREYRRHDKLSEEATDEDDVTSTDTDDEDEEDDEEVCAAAGACGVSGAGATLDGEGRLLTAAFCDLCRSTEALEQTGGVNERKSGAESESSPRESRPQASPRDNVETGENEGGSSGSLLAAPGQKWSNRRSSSPR